MMNLLDSEEIQLIYNYNESFRGYNNCVSMMEVIYLLFTFKKYLNIITPVSLVN